MEELLFLSEKIRELFKLVRSDRPDSSDFFDVFMNYNHAFREKVNDISVLPYIENASISLGIACAIQTITIQDIPENGFLKRKFAYNAMRQLTKGIAEYEQKKRWKAECAYWAILVLGKNYYHIQKFIIDALIAGGKSFIGKNMILVKGQLMFYLNDLIADLDHTNKTFTPLFDMENGIDLELIQELYMEWTEPATLICRQLNMYGDKFVEEYTRTYNDFVAALNKDNQDWLS